MKGKNKMNKLKLSLITIATLVASNTNAQTFYQCLPCPAGTYASNGTCTPCPAGTYSQVSGATSSAVCTACPDYQWSDEGATKCGWVKITLWKSDWSPKGYYFNVTSKEFYTKDLYGLQYGCGCEYFGTCGNSAYRDLKCGGINGLHIWDTGRKITLDCKKFPCEATGFEGRQFKIGEDGTIYNRLNSSYNWSSLGYKAKWD